MPRYCDNIARMCCALLCLSLAEQSLAALLPPATFYPVYLADPLRETFNAQYQHVSKTTIDDTGDTRFDLKLGANLPLYATEYAGMPWQLVLLAGFHGQFDNTQSQDNIGWDGIYGLHVAARLNEHWSMRLGTKHISAHVGDEYIERTGRTRINYTREELRVGLAWSVNRKSTLYSELGHAFDMRNTAVQEPWRAQLGAQYVSPLAIRQQPMAWYVAVDISSYEENDWDSNTTLQAGFSVPSGVHHWRLGVEFYDGRAQLGEFFQDTERYWSVGLWFDL